ncbi:MAG: arsenite methyltransferase [Bacteroidales bacterium]|nr:arsenite methyltransferase [Bacteroidales bacterium]
MKQKDLKQIVKEKYAEIAISENKSSCCSSSCCGPDTAYTVFNDNYENKEGYNPEADLSLGCGIPTDYAGIKKGDYVLDLGSGAGNDCFVARALVGEKGFVTGLDMTEQMIIRARENCSKLNYRNVEFVLGDIESMPFEAEKFDVVISNCVLNLVPDKSKAFSEIFRVLKPGGHFCVSDVVIKGNLPEKMKEDAEMYAGCVSGASEMNDYIGFIEAAGFRDIQIHKQKEITLPDDLLAKYSYKPKLENKWEEASGIYSITVSACKPR